MASAVDPKLSVENKLPDNRILAISSTVGPMLENNMKARDQNNMRDSTNQTAAIVIVVFLFLAVAAVTTVYCIFKRRRSQENKSKRTSDQVEDELINNLECSENFAEPDLGIIVGPRDKFTRVPVSKDWFDANLIPFMDNSVENLTDI